MVKFHKARRSASPTLARWLGYMFCAGALAIATDVNAQSSQSLGYVSRIYAADASNKAFRIAIVENGVDQLSSCLGSFAYVPTSDGNFNAKVAVAMVMYATQARIRANITKASDNYCTLNSISVP